MRNLHLRAQTFSQACHASGTGQINGAWPSLTAIHLLSIVNSSQPPTSRVISAHPIQFEKELDFRFSHKPTQAINLFNFLFICHTFRPQNTSQEKGAEKISMDRTEKKTPGCWSIPTLSFEGRQKPTKLTMAR